jgi:hypothetical protein
MSEHYGLTNKYKFMIYISFLETLPGMSQSKYEPIHSAHVERAQEKLVHQGHILAPSGTIPFLTHDESRPTVHVQRKSVLYICHYIET